VSALPVKPTFVSALLGWYSMHPCDQAIRLSVSSLVWCLIDSQQGKLTSLLRRKVRFAGLLGISADMGPEAVKRP
jgi:hypothetical protein